VAAAKVADDDNDVYTVRGGEAPSGCVDIYYLRRSISDAGRQGKEDAGRHFLNKVGESASMDPKPGLEGPFRGSPPAFPALRNGGKI